MKKVTLLITLFFTLTMNAQFVAKVADFHEIKVEDTLMKNTIERYVHYMETNPINYEKFIREFKAVKTVKRDRYYVGEYKDGVIYLNERLNDLPNTKRIIILQYLAEENGMRIYRKKTSPHISHRGFYLTDYTEDKFRRQFKRHNPYKFIVKKLKETSPLKYEF